MSEAYVASIMPVGIGAPIGDVTVGAVVISPKIDKFIHLESEGTGDMSQSVWLVHSKEGRLFRLTADFDSTSNTFKFTTAKTGLTTTPDQFNGPKFALLAGLAEYSKIIGFCPSTAGDAIGRTQVAMRNLERLIRNEYPEAVVVSDSMKGGGDLDKIMQGVWANDSPAVPSGVFRITEEALVNMTDSVKLRVLASGLLAEALAAAVRSVRVLDLSEMYPALRLETNWGFGGASLHNGLLKFMHFNDKGFRGKLTEDWVTWYEHNRSWSNLPSADTPVVPPTDPMFGMTRPASAAGSPVDGWNPPISKDAKDRETIQFDLDKALYMTTELMIEYERSGTSWDAWVKSFVPSVDSQLKARRRLSGRQMFLVWKNYRALCI